MEDETMASTTAAFTPVPNEDSVDIYEGLDVNDGSNTGHTFSAPSKLKESMDLYEEIVQEEQHIREASFSDLQVRFQAAQGQIQELHRRLQQMEIQNDKLNTENFKLKKNISALLSTARQEVARKDQEIQRLNKCLEKNGHRFRVNHLPDRISSSSSRSFSSCPAPPPSFHHPPPHSSAPLPPSRLLPPPPPLPPPPACAPPPLPPPPPPPAQPPAPQPPNLPRPPPTQHQQPPSTEGNASEITTPQSSSHKSSSSKSSYHGQSRSSPEDRQVPEKHTGLATDITTSQSNRHENVDKHRSRHREEKHQGPKQPELTEKRHRRDHNHMAGRRSHKSDSERRHLSRSEKNRSHQSASHRSDRSKSPLPEVQSNWSTSESERRIRERRRHKTGAAEGSKEGLDHHSRKTIDGHKRFDSKDRSKLSHSDSHGHSSSEKVSDRHSKDFKRHKRTAPSETREKTSDSAHHVTDAEVIDRQEKLKEASERSSQGAAEKSPNSKLSFMETLNLTQSPVKKPTPANGEELQKMTDDEAGPPAFEDMCVIDEVSSSEVDPFSAHADDVFNDLQSQEGMPEKGVIEEAAGSEPAEENQTDMQVGTDSPQAEERPTSFPPCGSTHVPGERSPQTKEVGAIDKHAAGSAHDVVPSKPDSNTVSSEEEAALIPSCEHQDTSIPPKSPPQEAASPAAQLLQDCRPSSDPAAFHSSPLKEDAQKELSENLDCLPQEGISLPEAILVLTQTEAEEVAANGTIKGCSTTKEVASMEKCIELKTPEKVVSKSYRSTAESPLLHDEDSMLRTLSNLRKIPDAISPLSSPIRFTKRGLLHSKPGFVKSLQKEFTSKGSDPNLNKLDVNKENKYPGSPAKREPQDMVEKLSDLASSVSETELEEGEILSECDEAAIVSPATKRAKLMRSVKTRGSPKSVLTKKAGGACETPKEEVEGFSQSPLNKSRFKMVCPASTKSYFSTIEEVMETFKSVRAEMRKKYMKLHKTFPRKSFYGVMENFQESFSEFVDGAHFGKICSQSDELKTKLKKHISTVFSKVANNGIVKRIFDQQAVDLKQKLWDFVDNQVDYLFKDIVVTLKELCKQTNAQPEDKRSREPKVYKPPPASQTTPPPPADLNRKKPCPYKTGLGSRGKDIKINLEDSDADSHHPRLKPQTPVKFLSPKKPFTPDKNSIVSLGISNSSILDKTDFEILTEQQASSLTFNLVRDSQMGEIFKCLLQGSDLLEAGGDSASWPLGTPRKDADRIITISTPTKFDSPSKLLTPSKFDTPSKLIATWSTISPRKISSPQPKVQLNPAIFDESCLMEVPSGSGAASQKTYSILAEDLAVSLTIPSPLKSDSHLSFLQPPNRNILSTPESVLSAHFSEDALMDGEDVSEHDIHLALDTDNSSCDSSSSVALQPANASFVFKPNLPVQALVMERSNDHFVLKIRQASTHADVTIVADESLSRTLTEEPQMKDLAPSPVKSPCKAPSEETSRREECRAVSPKGLDGLSEERGVDVQHAERAPPRAVEGTNQPTSPSTHTSNLNPLNTRQASESSESSPSCEGSQYQDSSSPAEEHQGSESERNLIITEDLSGSPQKEREKRRKRKKHQKVPKAKKSRKEEKKAERESPSQTSPTSNSLSAKNVVKKKGEVVIAWTRDEDRTILIELKTKGASRETFAFLSEKLQKPTEQIAQRFHQLMKLFKKQGKS